MKAPGEGGWGPTGPGFGAFFGRSGGDSRGVGADTVAPPPGGTATLPVAEELRA